MVSQGAIQVALKMLQPVGQLETGYVSQRAVQPEIGEYWHVVSETQFSALFP